MLSVFQKKKKLVGLKLSFTDISRSNKKQERNGSGLNTHTYKVDKLVLYINIYIYFLAFYCPQAVLNILDNGERERERESETLTAAVKFPKREKER